MPGTKTGLFTPGSVIQYLRKEKKLIISQLDDNTIQKLEDALKNEG